MLEFPMSFLDIVFPLNLPPLTYRCPDELAGRAVPGMLVAAPLKNRTAQGIILRRTARPPEGGTKEISRLLGVKPALGRPLLKLIEWMADYYIAPEGIVLKYTLPSELFPASRQGRPKPEEFETEEFNPLEIPEKDFAPLLAAADSGSYRTFLLRASARYQYSLAYRLACSPLRSILVFPEIRRAESFYASVRGSAGDRIRLLHSGMTTGQKRAVVNAIVNRECTTVAGTRAALFSPLEHPAVIMIVDEGNSSYRIDEGFRYHTRDVAVMRGFLEKSTVLLSSSAPSIDSSVNVMTGKYHALPAQADTARPRITIIDERNEKKVGPGMSRSVFQAAQTVLKKGGTVLFLMNRKGYASLITCAECGNTEECPDCRVPVVLYRGDTARCRYCGREFTVPDRCGRCGGHHLELLGAGTERIQETLDTLPVTGSVRIDKDTARKQTELKRLMKDLSGRNVNVAIGTKMLTKNLGIGKTFDMAAVLNADAGLGLPDFRAAEKTLIELSSVIDLVKPGGEVYIQTRSPASLLFRSLRNGRLEAFVQEELSLRKELGYPPYSRMIGLRHRSDARFSEKIIGIIRDVQPGVEALGPAVSRDRHGREEQVILIRHRDRKVLNAAARAVLERCARDKEAGLAVDVDPV